ncbi:DUF952 domain-containing protein [Ovoidimarina sediminis]|uniref:DUF952 domain-containing protein n=1 Tax=Ovoidimarina sediminis TaxID=3079856 RepID=UPI002913D247|nr:DUF952 domain-containing protein [Rhodophyticola sp. MJ-SS7]MDU8943342.1 DUF952 domain-containing protein [Rhodophyticola sp. MJ-SS7]
MVIYKILRSAEWAALLHDGATEGAPVDLADGFIHFSTAEQLGETAAKHFAGADGLWVLAVAADGLDALKWEPSRGGALFPHLYRALRLSELLWARRMPPGPRGHILPEGVE